MRFPNSIEGEQGVRNRRYLEGKEEKGLGGT